MKKPNIDFSKDGINKFFLHHIEKVILGVALALFGALFYLGYTSTNFNKSQPDALVTLADQAHGIMVQENWTKIAEFRQANDKADDIVNEPMDLKPSSYKIGYFIGTPAKTAGKRGDPDWRKIEGLMAVSLPINALMRDNPGDKSPFRGLKPASSGAIEEDNAPGGGRGMGGGGGLVDAPESGASERPKKRDDDDSIKPGTSVAGFIIDETVGVRPKTARLVPASHGAYYNAVVVTGVFPYKKQWESFDTVFKSAQGYWPLRDRPIYRYLEVQRKEVREENGEFVDVTEWEDISNRISTLQANYYSATAPEIVAPDYYDPVLTQPIPAILGDYRRFSNYPLGGQPVAANIKDIPFRSFGGETIEPVANNESENTGVGEFALRGNQDNLDKTDEKDKNKVRKGSDFSEYTAAIANTKQPKEDINKLVRFFDLLTDPGKTYQYQVRVWIADPNNEDPKGDFSASETKAGAGGGPNRGVGGGAAGGLIGEDENRGNPGQPGNSQPGQDEEESFVKVAVKATMLKSDVRKRTKPANRPELPGWITETLDPEKRSRDNIKVTMATELKNTLQYCWPSNWSDVLTVTVERPVESAVYSGPVVPAKTLRFSGGEVVDGEPMATLATTTMDRKFGTAVPLLKEASRGDYLNFVGNAHVADPVSLAVYLLENYRAKTNSLVVDIMGGDEVLGNRRDAVQYNMPGEILILGPDGQLTVTNELEDRGSFLRELFQDDEDGLVVTEETKADDDDRNGPGEFGGGSGR